MTKGEMDRGLEEIRRVRHEISSEVGHDPRRLLEYYRELQAPYEHRLIHAVEGTVEGPHSLAS
jgi:hypothetical protein